MSDTYKENFGDTFWVARSDIQEIVKEIGSDPQKAFTLLIEYGGSMPSWLQDADVACQNLRKITAEVSMDQSRQHSFLFNFSTTWNNLSHMHKILCGVGPALVLIHEHWHKVLAKHAHLRKGTKIEQQKFSYLEGFVSHIQNLRSGIEELTEKNTQALSLLSKVKEKFKERGDAWDASHRIFFENSFHDIQAKVQAMRGSFYFSMDLKGMRNMLDEVRRI